MDNKLRETLKEAFQPIVDKLVDITFNMYDKVISELPDTMSEDEQMAFVKPMIDSIAAGLSSSFDLIKPEDVLSKMKEAKDGK